MFRLKVKNLRLPFSPHQLHCSQADRDLLRPHHREETNSNVILLIQYATIDLLYAVASDSYSLSAQLSCGDPTAKQTLRNPNWSRFSVHLAIQSFFSAALHTLVLEWTFQRCELTHRTRAHAAVRSSARK